MEIIQYLTNFYNHYEEDQRLHYVAADGCALFMREVIDAMEEAMFQLFLKYHFATCERADLSGVTSHAIDIFQKD